MSGFKDMINRDIHKVFLNVDEFAETYTIKYDGKIYEDVAVSLQELSVSERDRQLNSDYAQGLYKDSTTMYCAAADLGGRRLMKGSPIEIIRRANGMRITKKYIITACSCEMGMIQAELGAVKNGPN